MPNYKQIWAKKQASEKKILTVCPDIPNKSGIYVFYREEKGIHFAYVGQARYLKSRCAEHLLGYQHIDNSIKKHGLYCDLNPNGYKIWYKECPQEQLDEMEQYYIKVFANKGYQLKNKTIGGQGEGKDGLENGREPKGYRDGLKQGYENCRKEIIVMFEKYLNYAPKSTGKIAERKLQEFRDFLNPIAMERLERIEEMKKENK